MPVHPYFKRENPGMFQVKVRTLCPLVKIGADETIRTNFAVMKLLPQRVAEATRLGKYSC